MTLMRVNISLSVDIDPERWAITHRINNDPQQIRENVRYAAADAVAAATGQPVSINNTARQSRMMPS